MVLEKDEIIELLRPVRDPEIGLSIVELDMVRNVVVSDQSVSLEIALTVQGCPLQKTIESDVRTILLSNPAIRHVDLKIGVMTKEEQFALSEELRRRRNENKPKGATEIAPGIYRYGKMNIQYVVGVVSGKGGVGKSLATAVLANGLSRQGFRVGVLDADITGPSMAKILGVNEKAGANDKMLIPATTKSGIKLISMNLILEKQTQAVIWRGPLVTRAIIQMYGQTDWGDLHFLLLDLPPGTSDAQLTVFQYVPLDGIIVVTTPQSLAHMIVEKALDMARVTKVPVLGLVENMSYLKCPHCGERIEMYPKDHGRDAEMLNRLETIGELPFDPRIAELADRGELEMYESPEVNRLVENVRRKILSSVPVSVAPIAWKKES